MISNRFLMPIYIYERTPFERIFIRKLDASSSISYDDLHTRQMYLEATIRSSPTVSREESISEREYVVASGSTVMHQDVMFGGITTYYEPAHVGGIFGALGQGLPPVEIVNTSLIPLAINDIIVPSGERQCINGPAQLWTIPLGFYVINKNGLYPSYRITTPITHIVYNSMQTVNHIESIPTEDQLSVSMEAGSGYDFGYRATGLTFW